MKKEDIPLLMIVSVIIGTIIMGVGMIIDSAPQQKCEDICLKQKHGYLYSGGMCFCKVNCSYSIEDDNIVEKCDPLLMYTRDEKEINW